MHFVSALDTVWGIRSVLGLHETVCSGAADGYARMSRKPALTLLHLGPGLANAMSNFHNMHRSGSPVLNLVGDMATWHKEADALLNMDVAQMAQLVSKRVFSCGPHDDIADKMKDACSCVLETSNPGESRIITFIAPHDLSWTRYPSQPSEGRSSREGSPLRRDLAQELIPSARAFIVECANSLVRIPRGKVAVYIGGRAALQDNGALDLAGRISAALGASLFCENSFARLDRGAGLPAAQRLPYFPQDAAATLSKFSAVLLIDVRRPVANFGYDGGPSQLINIPDDNVWELDAAEIDLDKSLRLLCQHVKGNEITPHVNCGGLYREMKRPTLPTGRLSATSLCNIIAALQPEGSIIVDESLTSGNAYWEASQGCPPFSHLTLTGGAIGCGPPMSVGAAIACEDRTVINFQADGSAMYSLQALWTQSRENLKVITVICANSSYAILKLEMAKQRITPSNGPSAQNLTNIGKPRINWVSLAEGMGVRAESCSTCEEMIEAFRKALDYPGPSLIEALI